MSSIRGKIITNFIKNKLNVGMDSGKDVIESLKKIDKPLKYVTPIGYTYEKMIVNGVKMEKLSKHSVRSNKVIYYLHGGAYILPMIDVYRVLAKSFSKAGHDCNVYFVDYRVAPEHKYPAAMEDALEGWKYLLSKGYKEEDIILMGDSAGGNLSLVLMLKLRQLGWKLPNAAVLISPWGDMTCSGESYVYNYNSDALFGSNYPCTEEYLEKVYQSDLFKYFEGSDRKDPFVSPVFAEYKDFPPTLFISGEHEVLISDSLKIVQKLKFAGCETTHIITPEMFHVFALLGPLMPESKRAFNKIKDFIEKNTENNNI